MNSPPTRPDDSPPGASLASKPALRAWMKDRLARVPVDDRASWSGAILARLRGLPLVASSRNVFTCLSFGAEPDTWLVADWLLQDPERNVYVPRCAKGIPDMSLHRYPCALETLSFGLRQPVATEPALPPAEVSHVIDCALVLGLAFDPVRGTRLGHGRGFFDRFLRQHRLTAIALAFEAQLVHGLPRDDHDVSMDLIVTEAGLYAVAPV